MPVVRMVLKQLFLKGWRYGRSASHMFWFARGEATAFRTRCILSKTGHVLNRNRWITRKDKQRIHRIQQLVLLHLRGLPIVEMAILGH